MNYTYYWQLKQIERWIKIINIIKDLVNVAKYKRRYNKISIKSETLKDKYIELLENKLDDCISREEFDSTIKSFNNKIKKLQTLKGGDTNGKNRVKRVR